MRRIALSSAVLGVAAYLASAAPACAHDTKAAAAPRPAGVLHQSPPAAPASLPVLAPLADPAVLLPIIEQSQAQGAPASKPAAPNPAATNPAAPNPSPTEAKPSSEPSTAEPAASEAAAEACEEDCPPKRKSELSLLPELILRNLEEVPLLAVMMMPVTEGVTITPAEGLPAVTFAVKPTKITRGSGLVAVGKF